MKGVCHLIFAAETIHSRPVVIRTVVNFYEWGRCYVVTLTVDRWAVGFLGLYGYFFWKLKSESQILSWRHSFVMKFEPDKPLAAIKPSPLWIRLYFLEIHAHLFDATVVNFTRQLERLHLKVGRFAEDPNFSGTWLFSLTVTCPSFCANGRSDVFELPSVTRLSVISGMEHLSKLIATLDAALIFRFACLKRQVVQGEIMTRHKLRHHKWPAPSSFILVLRPNVQASTELLPSLGEEPGR